jgi:hypothetical protein
MGTENRYQFSEPVELSLDGMPEEISSLEQFDLALSAKTQIDTQLFSRFMNLPDDKLAAFTVTTRQSADRLQAALKRAVDQPAEVTGLLTDFGPMFFTEDHQWRQLFCRLARLSSERNDLKLVALTKYRRYLLARLSALNGIGCNRLQSEIHLRAASLTEDVTQLALNQPDVTQELSSSETFIRDVVRLPRGQTLGLRAESEASVEIWLSKRKFRIEMWEETSLIDTSGQSTKLKEGRNMVGRALYNDVVVDPSYNEVSRSHMIVDIAGGRPVRITDLSSGGTYVSRTLVAS